MIYRTALFSATLNDPDFKVTPSFDAEYLTKVTKFRHHFSGILIGTKAHDTLFRNRYQNRYQKTRTGFLLVCHTIRYRFFSGTEIWYGLEHCSTPWRKPVRVWLVDCYISYSKEGLGGLRPAQSPPRCTKCNRAVPQTPIVGVYRCISGNSKLPRWTPNLSRFFHLTGFGRPRRNFAR